jgi:hypothetical protein
VDVLGAQLYRCVRACAEIVKSSYLKMGLAPNLSQGDWLVAKLDFGGDA